MFEVNDGQHFFYCGVENINTVFFFGIPTLKEEDAVKEEDRSRVDEVQVEVEALIVIEVDFFLDEPALGIDLVSGNARLLVGKEQE